MIKSIRDLLVIGFTVLSFSISFTVLAAQQQKREKSAVLGRVTVNGKPAAGIIVALLPGDFTGTISILDKATTDADGQYVLTASGSGRYSVAPLAPGYTAESASAFRQSGKEINLSNGETVRDINFSLKRGGVITGRITRNDGRPLINFPINVRSVDEEDGRTDDIFFQNRFMNRTDDRGVYRLYGLQPGKYIISVGVNNNGFGRVTSNGNAVIPITYFPSVDDIANATTIEVKEGAETTNIDITARKPEKLYTVSGRIIDSTSGRPVPNIRYGISRDGGRGFDGFGFNQTQTNARGEFFVTGVSPGKYNVYGVADDNNNYYSEKVAVEVNDHDMTNIDVKLFQGVSLSGVVSVEGAGDTDISGEMAKLQLFTYSPLAGRGGANGRQAGQVNGDGSFTISGITPGQFELALAGFRRSNFSMLRIERNGSIVNNAFEAQGGEKITGVRVVLGYGNAVINGLVKFNGPIPQGIRLFVTYQCLTCEGVTRNNFAQVDARGAFTITGLMPGDYEVNLRAFQPGRRRLPPLGKQTVKTVAGQSVDVTLVGDLNDEQQPGKGPEKGDDSE